MRQKNQRGGSVFGLEEKEEEDIQWGTLASLTSFYSSAETEWKVYFYSRFLLIVSLGPCTKTSLYVSLWLSVHFSGFFLAFPATLLLLSFTASWPCFAVSRSPTCESLIQSIYYNRWHWSTPRVCWQRESHLQQQQDPVSSVFALSRSNKPLQMKMKKKGVMQCTEMKCDPTQQQRRTGGIRWAAAVDVISTSTLLHNDVKVQNEWGSVKKMWSRGRKSTFGGRESIHASSVW